MHLRGKHWIELRVKVILRCRVVVSYWTVYLGIILFYSCILVVTSLTNKKFPQKKKKKEKRNGSDILNYSLETFHHSNARSIRVKANYDISTWNPRSGSPSARVTSNAAVDPRIQPQFPRSFNSAAYLTRCCSLLLRSLRGHGIQYPYRLASHRCIRFSRRSDVISTCRGYDVARWSDVAEEGGSRDRARVMKIRRWNGKGEACAWPWASAWFRRNCFWPGLSARMSRKGVPLAPGNKILRDVCAHQALFIELSPVCVHASRPETAWAVRTSIRMNDTSLCRNCQRFNRISTLVKT